MRHSDSEEGDGFSGEQSRTEQTVSPKASKVEIRWNREGKQNLFGGYRKGSKRILMRRNKSARELEKDASRTYNIQALWQRSRPLIPLWLGRVFSAHFRRAARLTKFWMSLVARVEHRPMYVSGFEEILLRRNRHQKL